MTDKNNKLVINLDYNEDKKEKPIAGNINISSKRITAGINQYSSPRELIPEGIVTFCPRGRHYVTPYQYHAQFLLLFVDRQPLPVYS